MENKLKQNKEPKHDAKPVSAPVFDFQKGDIIEFCDEHYFVIENQGSQGVVTAINN